MQQEVSFQTSGTGLLHLKHTSRLGVVLSDLHFVINPSRIHPSPEAVRPPSSLAMDTLSTLREVSSNPPSPENSPTAVFPQLVISPPLSGGVGQDMAASGNGEAAKPQNGLDRSPTEETQGLDTPRLLLESHDIRLSTACLSNSKRKLILVNIRPFHSLPSPCCLTLFFLFPGPARCVVPPPSWDPRHFAGPQASSTGHQPGRGGASSPSSSPGSRPRGQSAACRVPRLLESGDEAWPDFSPDDHLVHLGTLCSSPTPSTTTTSRE